MSAEDLARQAWHDFKVSHTEQRIGKQHDLVLHAIVSHAIGGALDLYYFDNQRQGTAIVTMELSEEPGHGPSNSLFKAYELAMFMRHAFNAELAQDESTLIGREHGRISAFLNALAPYCSQTAIERFDICEFPQEFDEIGGRCLIFDAISTKGSSSFGLMLPIEIFRSEMDFARLQGGEKLIDLLKQNGVHPYSMLDRSPVT